MQFFTNMKVGSKILLLVVILLLCIATAAGLGIRGLGELNTVSNRMYEVDVQALSASKEANLYLLYASRTVRNLLLAPPERVEQYKTNYPKHIKNMLEQLDQVKGRVRDPKNITLWNETREAIEVLLPKERAIIDKVGVADKDELFQLLIESREQTNKVDDLMTLLSNAMVQEAEVGYHETTAIYEWNRMFSLVCLGAALLFGILIGLATRRSIAVPLMSVAHKAELVAKGDLDQDFSMDRKDEIGILAHALAQMVENLRTRIAEAEQKSREAEEQSREAAKAGAEAQVAKEKAEEGQKALLTAAGEVEMVVDRLSAATEELSAQVEESSRGTDVQRDRVSNSATAMEEMNSTVLEVARNAGVASEGSERAREKAAQGEDIVRRSVGAINEVQNDTNVLKDNMESLGRQAEAIGTIMTVISDIADQTNLLALNAAIEAARAGEAGRGFAVVADEVRKLAEKTMVATAEVGQAIRDIQAGTQKGVTGVREAADVIETANALAGESGEALSAIVSLVEAASDQVRSIAAASEEQSAASESIEGTIADVGRVSEDTAQAMEQAVEAVADLAGQARVIEDLIDELRGDRGRPAMLSAGA